MPGEDLHLPGWVRLEAHPGRPASAGRARDTRPRRTHRPRMTSGGFFGVSCHAPPPSAAQSTGPSSSPCRRNVRVFVPVVCFVADP
jgi:hypothetical protein